MGENFKYSHSALNRVLGSVVGHYLAHRDEKWVGSRNNRNWMPIAWFGNLDAYFASPRRIVTVGINPSQHEFPVVGPPRFDKGVLTSFRRAKKAVDIDLAAYRKTLCEYFETNPYCPWFGRFNKVLFALGASYGSYKCSSCVLHIDLMTPLPTDRWSQLETHQRREVSDCTIFHSLMAVLKPDLAIFVPGKTHLEAAGLKVTPFRRAVSIVANAGAKLAVQRSQNYMPCFNEQDIKNIISFTKKIFNH